MSQPAPPPRPSPLPTQLPPQEPAQSPPRLPTQLPTALPAPLAGLFRALLARGVPLGVRDYLDGLRALRAGFGHGDKSRVHALAQTLWARSDEERRLIAQWFEQLPLAGPSLVEQIDALLESAMPRESAASPMAKDTLPAGHAAAPPTPDHLAPSPGAGEAPRARVSFAARGEGLSLPRVDAAPLIGETYVLQPQALIGARELAQLWRRFRRSTRSGPRREVDVAATIAERCRRGVLRAPVCRPRRSNSARLLVLVDVSASMEPWQPFIATLIESLRLGQLPFTLRYFSNLPKARLYASAQLTEVEQTDEVLRHHLGASLLILSDAGSARGFLNRRRAVQTAAFLAAAAPYCPARVWLNPMPQARWAGSTAALLQDAPVSMLALSQAQLVHAVDILRGNK